MEKYSQSQANEVALSALAYCHRIACDYERASLELAAELSQIGAYRMQFLEAYRMLREQSFIFADAPTSKNRQKIESAYFNVIQSLDQIQSFQAKM
jgi:hypothetical protein